jgi:Cation transporter/ATPase, N-terminus
MRRIDRDAAARRGEATRASDTAAAGLSSAEAARLLAEVGPNEIPEERRSLLLEIGSHF